jgi:HPt (histidine-containing phosphotransfer) domain-containing protein
VLQLFCGQSAVYLGDLRKAATLAQWRQAAHSLKGSAKAVGVARIVAAATCAETLAALNADQAREDCLKEMAAAIAETDQYIRSLP